MPAYRACASGLHGRFVTKRSLNCVVRAANAAMLIAVHQDRIAVQRASAVMPVAWITNGIAHARCNNRRVAAD
jgi:hypothetical protein